MNHSIKLDLEMITYKAFEVFDGGNLVVRQFDCLKVLACAKMGQFTSL